MSSRNLPVKFPDTRKHGLRVEVPRQSQDSIIWHIEHMVMIIEVVACDGVEVCHIANDFVVIRMDTESRLLHRLAKLKNGFVLITLTLGDNDGTFRCDLFFIEVAVDHAVRFETEYQIDLISRHGRVVCCPIEIGHGIPRAAFARNSFIEHVCRKFGSALELHMFNPMRDSCASLHLITRANAIPHPRRDDR